MFMDAYFEQTHLFFQRNPQNHFVFVPSINTTSNKTNDILNHSIAIGKMKTGKLLKPN